MKTRMMVSMLVIALAAAVVGGATMAWFTDSTSVEGNSFAAGTLQVSLTGPQAGGLPFAIENMAPGDPASVRYMYLNNDGSLPMLFRFYVQKTDGESPEGGNLEDVLMVRITLNPTDHTPETTNPTQGNPDQFVWEGLLVDLIGVSNALDNIAAAKAGYPLPAGYSDIYKIAVWLPTTAGNEYQGASFEGTLHVEATQFSNQDLDNVSWVE